MSCENEAPRTRWANIVDGVYATASGSIPAQRTVVQTSGQPHAIPMAGFADVRRLTAVDEAGRGLASGKHLDRVRSAGGGRRFLTVHCI